ncbi:MAG: trans-sulfuration enzyme family protein [Minwuia sp.]|uniref:trans-sulfuration enzyme family protein n=1 Tax=Minwuia sp. TaxID=2493630 RepID=UPI003A840EF4
MSGADDRPATYLAQALGHVEPKSRGLAPAIYPATTYERDPDLSLPGGAVYARDENPSFHLAEEMLARLEGGQRALVFASGMAAAAALFQALKSGDSVIAPEVMYFALKVWLKDFGERFGLDIRFVGNDAASYAAALKERPARLVWVETPCNPLWHVTDIATVAEACKAAGAKLAVDNTVPTPLHTRPLDLGADFVMHAATKSLNGHSDVMAGALVTGDAGDALWQGAAAQRHMSGAVLGPFEAWLLARGMRTLAIRVERASANAMRIAEWLEARDGVSVLYPGLQSHPGHAVAARQMTGGYGAMLSVLIGGGAERAKAVKARLRIFRRATSLGGVESLVEHRHTVEGAATMAPPDLLRLSVGIEDADDLIADLAQALDG